MHPSPGTSGRWTPAHRPAGTSGSSPGSTLQFAWPKGSTGGIHKGAERCWDPRAALAPCGLRGLLSPFGLATSTAWMCPPASWQHPCGKWMLKCHRPPRWHHHLVFIKLFARSSSFCWGPCAVLSRAAFTSASGGFHLTFAPLKN